MFADVQATYSTSSFLSSDKQAYQSISIMFNMLSLVLVSWCAEEHQKSPTWSLSGMIALKKIWQQLSALMVIPYHRRRQLVVITTASEALISKYYCCLLVITENLHLSHSMQSQYRGITCALFSDGEITPCFQIASPD